MKYDPEVNILWSWGKKNPQWLGPGSWKVGQGKPVRRWKRDIEGNPKTQTPNAEAVVTALKS